MTITHYVFFSLFLLIISIVTNAARIPRFKSIRSSSSEKSARERIIKLVQTYPVMFFSQINCCYSIKAKNILTKYLGRDFAVLEIDPYNSALDVYYDVFEELMGAATLRRVYIGGADEVEILDNNGGLQQLLKEAKALIE